MNVCDQQNPRKPWMAPNTLDWVVYFVTAAALNVWPSNFYLYNSFVPFVWICCCFSILFKCVSLRKLVIMENDIIKIIKNVCKLQRSSRAPLHCIVLHSYVYNFSVWLSWNDDNDHHHVNWGKVTYYSIHASFRWFEFNQHQFARIKKLCTVRASPRPLTMSSCNL